MQISIKNNPSYAYKQEEDEKMYYRDWETASQAEDGIRDRVM